MLLLVEEVEGVQRMLEVEVVIVPKLCVGSYFLKLI